MAIAVVPGADATHANVSHLPKGIQACGYSTGTPDIQWTTADWAAHPGAIRICQDSGATDETADVLDVESGAATPAECPGWVTRARASFTGNKRKGQRQPSIYVNESNIHLVANALAGGKVSNVGLWVANWNLTESEASSMVANSGGPYPVIGVQYSDQGGGGTYDEDVFSEPYLKAVSGAAPPPTGPYRHVVPPGNGNSLWRVAQDRRVNEQSLITLSQANLNSQNLAIFNAYVQLETLLHDAKLPRPAMPAGLVYYTLNP